MTISFISIQVSGLFPSPAFPDRGCRSLATSSSTTRIARAVESQIRGICAWYTAIPRLSFFKKFKLKKHKDQEPQEETVIEGRRSNNISKNGSESGTGHGTVAPEDSISPDSKGGKLNTTSNQGSSDQPNSWGASEELPHRLWTRAHRELREDESSAETLQKIDQVIRNEIRPHDPEPISDARHWKLLQELVRKEISKREGYMDRIQKAETGVRVAENMKSLISGPLQAAPEAGPPIAVIAFGLVVSRC